MTLYMYIENDEYELPIYVADSIAELARVTGLKYNTVAAAFSRAKHGKRKSLRFRKVEVEDD